MIQSLNSGLSGLEAFQNQMAVIGNDISNSNTVGFKSSRTDFASALSQSIGTVGSNGSSIGGGVLTSDVQTLFQQGQLSQTNAPGDLAITGPGFFVVRDPGAPATSPSYATRDGEFNLDSSGYIVTNSGQRVQGLATGATSLSDIKLVPTSGSATPSSFTVASDGTITGTFSDGSTSSFGKIALQNFTDPQALTSQGNNLFTITTAAGAQTAAAPGSPGLGTVQSGYVEMSNVDLAGEMASLITAQRGFEANAKIVTTSDEVLQAVIGLKR